jgi:hypothetical protein
MLYRCFFFRGFLIAILGVALSVISAFYPISSITYGCLNIIGSFLRTLGVCLLVVVPVDEFDPVAKLVEEKNYRVRFVVVFITLILAVIAAINSHGRARYQRSGTAFALVPTFFLFLLLYPELDETTYIYLQFTFTYSIGFVFIAAANVTRNLGNFKEYRQYYHYQTGILYGTAVVLLSVLALNDLIFVIRNADERHGGKGMHKGWGAWAVYKCMLLLSLVIGIASIFRGIKMLEIREFSGGWYLIFVGITTLLPIAILPFTGITKFFSLLARGFENNIETRRNDGASMAFLLNASRNQKDTDINWCLGLFTGESSNLTKSDSIFKARKYQMSFDEWRDINFVDKDDPESDEWGVDKIKRVEHQQCPPDSYVVVKKEVMRDSLDANRWKDELKKLAMEELCHVSWNSLVNWSTRQWEELKKSPSKLKDKEFKLLLFEKSPRDMEKDQKEKMLKEIKMTKVSTGKNTKIDYFVSHAWNDNCECLREAKYNALNHIADQFQRSVSRCGSSPTFWLDKFCLVISDDKTLGAEENERITFRNLAVLPINVGSCDKMLILMSKNYMRRLWCVWELFTLFTFCSKETMAEERIKIFSIDGCNPEDELENFDLDSAHCFDPNEEFHLRNIIKKIEEGSGKKLKEYFGELAKIMRKRKDEPSVFSVFLCVTQEEKSVLVTKDNCKACCKFKDNSSVPAVASLNIAAENV